MMKISDIRSKADRLQGRYDQISQDITNLKEERVVKEESLRLHEEAKTVVQQVAIKTQEQLQYHISDITSLALEAVFPEPYKLELKFETRRNKTECDILFTRDGLEIDPLEASGGGVVDVAAFALRIASWSLSQNKTRPTIILDEPLKWVSEGLKESAASMLKQVSAKLGIQFIVVTHEPKLTQYADKIFEVKKKRKVSSTRELT